MGGKCRTAEQIIAAIANEAHGIVTRAELIAAGVSARATDRRLERGSLLPVFRGVFRVGHAAPSVEARYMAAVKACGEGSVLSGRAAAFLWGLLRGDPPPPEVTARTERRIKGMHTRRCRDLDARDTTTHRGIPVTTLARTLVDLAAVLNEDELARAFHKAAVRYRAQPEDVEAVLARRANAPGAEALRRVVRGDTQVTLSRLERAFLKRLKERGLPLPATNHRIGGRYVDCRWPDDKLTVELDGYRYHATRHAWALDRKREREAYARGDQFRRYTSDDVFDDPRAMYAELEAVLLHPPS